MLVRSAARRQRRHNARVLAASFAQLNLPWLAPAQWRWSATRAAPPLTTASTARRSGNPSSSTSSTQSSRVQTRLLATPSSEHFASSDGASAYDQAFQSSVNAGRPPWNLSQTPASGVGSHLQLETNKFHSPILLNKVHASQSPDPVYKVNKSINGTVVELLQYLRTSLQVGRQSRAEVILQRLANTLPATSPELAYAHTVYLESMLQMVLPKGMSLEGKQKFDDMHLWFEEEIKAKGVAVTPKMLVVMIRGVLAALDGSQREVRIENLVKFAQALDSETYDEVLFSEEYTDEEFNTIGAITSPYRDVDFDDVLEEEEAELRTHTSSEQYRRLDQLSLDGLNEVLSTDLKGSGLSNVKRVIASLNQHDALPPTAPIEEQRRVAMDRQRQVERDSAEIAVEMWREANEELRKVGVHTTMQSKPVAAMMWDWYCALLPELQKEKDACSQKMGAYDDTSASERYLYGPYLEALSIEKIAASTLLQTLSCLVGMRPVAELGVTVVKAGYLTYSLGEVIQTESSIDAARLPSSRTKKLKSMSAHRLRRSLARQLKWQHRSTPDGVASTTERKPVLQEHVWPTVAKVKLGAMLVGKLLETAQIPVTRRHPRTGASVTQMQPAFLHRKQFVGGKSVGVIQLNPVLLEKLQNEPIGNTIAKRLPMVVEPRPWTGWHDGGYLSYDSDIMRFGGGDPSGKEYLQAAHDQNDLAEIYAGLNALGKVPWKIHHGVFQVQLQAWNSGEAIANFAPLKPKFTPPPEPPPTATVDDRRTWLREVKNIEDRRAGIHSQRCFQNMQLEVARSMVNDTLFFPHNLDFRGRAYPIPPYLNHMGADNVRGLLVFANGKPLGPNGLRWLKIHLATVAGRDKASLDERLEFTEQHIDEIYDSARNPLDGNRWWLKAEDAWQTLAACFELTAALDSPNPAEFISHLPIQQDGTCNGLQHYAALGGDKAGAAQVNLEPSDRPADVYSAVLHSVEQEIAKDSQAGNAIAQTLEGRINRKCVKQPVMTNVYGVTYYGAREQVKRQLAVLFPEITGYGPVSIPSMAAYMTDKIFLSLGKMFKGAQAIQHWFGICADRISVSMSPDQVTNFVEDLDGSKNSKSIPKSKAKKRSVIQNSEISDLFKTPVIWTTPLRLPVVQPYRKAGKRTVKTTLQAIDLQDPQVWSPVSKRKQISGFAPNFIHSLDASHMLLSALKCAEVGINFASIHDSFWCHASDVDRMSKLLRDAFVTMHKEDIIGRLREEFETRYQGYFYHARIDGDSHLARRIRKWRTENGIRQSSSASSELKLELERKRLLNSDDPADHAEGRAMVTPGSLAEEENGQFEHIFLPSAINTVTLGRDLSNMTPAESETQNLDMSNSNEQSISEKGISEKLGASSENDNERAAYNDKTGEHKLNEMFNEEGEPAPKQAKTSSNKKPAVYVWLPMAFPPVPAKGDFDVSRLLSSRYFFH